MGVTLKNYQKCRGALGACAACVAMAVAGTAVHAGSGESAGLAPIDQQLSGQLDFRDLSFQVCFEQTTCTVDGVTVEAYRIDSETEEREPERIYWDPVDGFGVMDGGQNDEIDFDEILVVKFPEPRTVSTLWLSDMFSSEHKTYGGASVIGRDVEYARIEWVLDEAIVAEHRVSSEVDLPADPFNKLLGFSEHGDLRKRIIIDEDTIQLLIEGQRGSDVLIDAPLAEIDVAKLSIFEGIPTVEIDITDLLREFTDAPLFPVGTENAALIERYLESEERLAALWTSSRRQRAVSSVDNGEVDTVFDPAIEADTVVFLTPLDSSNEYSVAGLVFAE